MLCYLWQRIRAEALDLDKKHCERNKCVKETEGNAQGGRKKSNINNAMDFWKLHITGRANAYPSLITHPSNCLPALIRC